MKGGGHAGRAGRSQRRSQVGLWPDQPDERRCAAPARWTMACRRYQAEAIWQPRSYLYRFVPYTGTALTVSCVIFWPSDTTCLIGRRAFMRNISLIV